jgi:hypothetical protein
MKQHIIEEITYTLEDLNNKSAVLERYPESLDNDELLQVLNELAVGTKVVCRNITKLKRKVFHESEKIQSSWG